MARVRVVVSLVQTAHIPHLFLQEFLFPILWVLRVKHRASGSAASSFNLEPSGCP